MYNIGLLTIIHAQPISLDAADRLYQHVIAKWPQINPATTVTRIDRDYYHTVSYEVGIVKPLSKLNVTHKPGGKARLWRTIGMLADNPKWIANGMDTEWIVPSVAVHRDVRLEYFGVSYKEERSEAWFSASLAVAYDPVNDRLYIKV